MTKERIDAVDAVAKRYGLAGEVLVGRGDRILLDHAYGPIAPAGGARHRAGERWRLASITKQVTAALIVKTWQDRLNDPIDRGSTLGALTMRQLLQHHSGLANPDVTPAGADGVPAFYRTAEPGFDYCRSKPAVPGSAFSYHNCDYVLASQANETLIVAAASAGQQDDAASGQFSVFHVTGWHGLVWPAGLAMARPNEAGVPGFVGGKPEPRFQLASYGAAGGLMGTARAVFAFDRSLMTGTLLPAAARDGELWKPEGNGSYQALGAWVFPGKLRGCAAPERIVQRDGEIWGVQARNYILPDDDISVVVFTNRSADDFAIGEAWEGKGFAFDLLSAAVGC